MQWSPYRLWAWRGALGMFLAYLLLRALHIRNIQFEPVHWDFDSQAAVTAWLGRVLWHELVVYGLSFLLGLLVPPALGPVAADEYRQRRWPRWAGFCGFGLLTLFLCFAIARSEAPPLGSLILPFGSYLFGLHLSSAAMRGKKASLGLRGGIVSPISTDRWHYTCLGMHDCLRDATEIRFSRNEH